MSRFSAPVRRVKAVVGAFALASALLLLIGCGGNPQLTEAQLSGSVRYKDAPLPGGYIRILSTTDPNKSQSGMIKADGTYEVLNAPVGEVKVLIDTATLKSHPALMAGPGKATPGGPKTDVVSIYGGQLKYVPIDKKYNDPAATTLQTAVQKGPNTADFVVD